MPVRASAARSLGRCRRRRDRPPRRRAWRRCPSRVHAQSRLRCRRFRQMALRPQRKSTASESRRAAAAMPARKETGMTKMGGGQAAWVRGWWERVLIAQRRYIGPQTRRPVRNVQQQQPASGRADQRQQLAPSTRREEAARGRRRGTDLVEVNCTEAGAAGGGRARGVAHGVRRRALTDLH